MAAYFYEMWDESGGYLTLPTPSMNPDGGGQRYLPLRTATIAVNRSTSTFTRIDVVPPLIVDGGNIFVSVATQTLDSIDDTTVAIDTSPLVPGANSYRVMNGFHFRLDLPDGGFYRGVNHNWIIRLVLEAPDTAVVVSSVFPNAGPPSAPTAVVISGANFELGASASVGTTPLTLQGITPPNTIQATVPAGLSPGRYDVKVTNPGGLFGVLPNGFEVLLLDGGSGTGGGAGGGPGGGSGGSGGWAPGVLMLDDITGRRVQRRDDQGRADRSRVPGRRPGADWPERARRGDGEVGGGDQRRHCSGLAPASTT